MYKSTAEQRQQKMLYIMAYRAIRAYQSGQSTINPLTALRTVLDILPTAIAGNTVFTINKAQASFNQRHQAPKGVHEPLQYTKAKFVQKATKRTCGISSLRVDQPSGKVPTMLHMAKLHASAHKVVLGYTHLLNQDSTHGFKVSPCTPIERLMLKSDMLRILGNLPLSA